MSLAVYPPPDVVAQPRAVTAHVSKTTNTTIAEATHTLLSFPTVRHDTDGMYSTAAQDRLTVRTPGKYLVWATVAFGSAAGNYRHANLLRLRGGNIDEIAFDAKTPAGGGNYTGIAISCVLDCEVGDQFQLQVYQVSGGPVDLIGANYYGQQMGATLLSGNANGLPSGARVRRNAAWSHPTNSNWVVVPWDTPENDTDALWTAADPTKLFARKAGWFVVTASVSLSPSGTGAWRAGQIRKNGTDAVGDGAGVATASASARVAASAVVFLRAGDYLEYWLYQDSGGALAIAAGGQDPACEMAMVCITGTTVSQRERPGAQLRGTNVQTAASGVGTFLTFASAEWDTDGMLDPVTGYLKCRTAGRYVIEANVEFPNTNATGIRQIALSKNGVYHRVVSADPRSDGYWHAQLVAIIDLLPGDVVNVEVYHTAGVSLSIGHAANWRYVKSLTAILQEPISAAALATPEALHVVGAAGEPPFLNGHSQYAGFVTVGFWKDPFGMVHLQGLVAGLALNQTIFTLPVGYRPPASVLFAGVSNNAVARVNVGGSNGIVSVEVGSAGSWVNLDNVRFRTT